MPADQYVYFEDGSETLLTAVTTTPVIENIAMPCDPYRDLGHRGTQETTITSVAGQGLDIVELDNTALETGHTFAPGNADINGVSTAIKTGITSGSSNTWGPTISVPDNVSHVPPRQVDILVPHWKFVCSDGIDKFFRVDKVVGWGQNTRT